MTTVDTPRSSRSVLVTVAAVVEETPDSRSLVFDLPEARKREFVYKPGQFLTLRIPSELTGSVARCYSLASSPFTGELPKVTVKRTAGGYGSNWLCDNVDVGDIIEVLPPAGLFTPATFDDDLLLFAAGSGITPVMSILKSALTEGDRDIVLVYANRDEKSVIFAEELRELSRRHHDRLTVIHWLESVQGLPTPEQLARISARLGDHRAFLCGPRPFMDVVHAATALTGVPRDRAHAEVFTSLSGDPFADMAPVEAVTDEGDTAEVTVRMDGEVHNLTWPRRSTLVDIMIARGLDVPYSCREGECGSCACTVVDGEVAMENAAILDPEDVEDGYILACQARPVSKHVEIEF
ncbi:MAG: ferredoxin--NADP reductase [Rhodococcus sp. (in: high G+C Gram-positive bacteria)]|uniref:2Fe-2S iron-sulfur cluster-binding protein n=1 Tax=Rhodococcus sp. TaxID=1831 RepID=UPI003BAF2FFA